MATFPSVTGLVLRLKAADIGGLSDGDPISTWSDLSASSNDATASTTARPTYRASGGPNNSAYVEFNGTTNRMSCGTPADMQNQDYSLYLVTAVNGGSPNFDRQMTWSAGATSGSDGIGYALFATSTTSVVTKGRNVNPEDQTSVSRAFTGLGVWTWCEGHYTAAGSLDVADRDTNSNSSTPPSLVDYTDITHFHIGGFDNGTDYFFDGNIVEICVMDTEQGTTEKANLATYFEDEYFPATVTRDGGVSIDKAGGTQTYIASLDNGTVTVQQHTTSTFFVNQTATFGTCTVADWGNRVKFLNVYAPPFTWLSNCADYCYAFGRYDSSGIKHMALSTDAGATFGGNIGPAIGTDYISAMFAVDENTLYAFRAGSASRALYRTQDAGAGSPTWTSLGTLPFDVAAASLGADGRLAICSLTTSGDQVAIAEGPLFATWNDATGDVATTGKGAIAWV